MIFLAILLSLEDRESELVPQRLLLPCWGTVEGRECPLHPRVLDCNQMFLMRGCDLLGNCASGEKIQPGVGSCIDSGLQPAPD